jgi:radical SAM superfamily enzyme YgiQ (UPF0313 family)
MNVLFVFSAKDSKDERMTLYEEMQFGISYISSFLKKSGHATRLVYLTGASGAGAIDRYIEEFRPGLICFTAVFSQYRFIASVAGHVKRTFPDVFLLAGGPHITLRPEECLADPFDAWCIGEGELPTLELVQQLERGAGLPARIPNLWIRQGDVVEKNPARAFIADLDAMPWPDREMWREWVDEPDSRQVVFIGRGCPFPCTYCSNHALKRVAAGEYVRYRKPGAIVSEIAAIRESFPRVKEVYLEIESFTVNMPWALEVCDRIAAFNATLPVPLTFGVNLRLTGRNAFDELFAAMRKANFRFVNIGLESGSERVRKEVLKRYYTNADVVKTVQGAKAYGFRVNLFVLIGIPGETLEDFRETVRVLREASPDYCGDSIFYPYPGTELYEVALRQGLIGGGQEEAMERRRATLDLPGFSRDQIMRGYIWFDHYVYRGVRPWYQIYPRVANKAVNAIPALSALFNNPAMNWLRRKLRGVLRPSNQ